MSEQNGVRAAMAHAKALDEQTRDIRDACSRATLVILTLAAEVARLTALAAVTPREYTVQTIVDAPDGRYFRRIAKGMAWGSFPVEKEFCALGVSPTAEFWGPQPQPPEGQPQ